jgi:hypothetical protein
MEPTDLAALAAAGGASQRKYERLSVEAQGATPGSAAAEAKRLFEEQWCTDPAAAEAAAAAEEKASAKETKKAEKEAEKAAEAAEKAAHPPRRHR